MRFEIITAALLTLIFSLSKAQTNKTTQNRTIDWTDKGTSPLKVSLRVESDVKTKELSDYFRFERINYFNISIIGSKIDKQYFILTSEEFWNSELVLKDTLANTKSYNLKNGSDTLDIRVMSRNINSDSVRFQFYLPKFSSIKQYKVIPKDIYSLRDITSGQVQTFDKTKPIILLVHSLPYEDPKKPGHLFYCKLSVDGIPPENWGEKFGVKHYIIFKLHLID